VKKGTLLGAALGALTLILIMIGTIWPAESALKNAGTQRSVLRPSSTPLAAVENLGDQIRGLAMRKAYDSLANKAQFTEPQFVGDLTGYYPSLLTYASVAGFDVRSLHSSPDDAEMELKLHWATVVGLSTETRDLHVVRNGDRWMVEWPIVKAPRVPAQVIPVNYLRWDVIYSGASDEWGSQDVEAPHIRIVDMQPVERADGIVILGELLNEDVVPAYVTVSATLLSKTKTPMATEGSFDKISHLLLPKQVTPFLIKFPHASLADVGGIRMTPLSSLIAASADPVVLLANEQLHPAPDASLTGQLINQSGQIVNVAHVLGTFYDKDGHVVWIADQYVDQALLPQTPVPFQIHIPEDLAKNITSQRAVVSTYQAGGNI
jgi:hypothetical protein